ncbi:MAG: hypothetical protein P4L77_10755 [Sulfuriferula sp.]|nr:hypothetical protein [Sulfuriferula sp.]
MVVRPNNSTYYGSQAVTYRRINITNYFRNLILTLDDYVGSTTMTIAQMVAAVNLKFGTAFVTTDFSVASITSTVQNSLTIVSTSLCYEGVLSIKWTQGKQYISQAVTNPVLVGRLYPTSNTNPPAKPQADFLTYNLDNSSIKAALLGLTSGAAITPAQFATANSIYATILGWLQQKRPDLNLTGVDSATTGGLGNLVWTRYTIPAASVPGANSAKFTTLFTIQSVAGSWFQGMFYLHYNA